MCIAESLTCSALFESMQDKWNEMAVKTSNHDITSTSRHASQPMRNIDTDRASVARSWTWILTESTVFWHRFKRHSW